MTKYSKLFPVILAVAALVLTASTFALVTVTKDVSSTGTITTTPNIGVYSDSACTNPLSALNWESVGAGSSTTQVVYVKNTGTGTMTLSLSTSVWSPSGASSYINVNWDKQGSTLNGGQSTAAILTLGVSPSITGITTFSNTITISGTA